MKLLNLVLITLFIGMFISCSKDDATPSQTTTSTDGNWRASLYFDNSDETYKFTSYTFIFNSNGTVAATNGSINANGTWSQVSSKFNIDFGVTPVFSDLNDDWLINEKTSTSIKLKDDNPARNEKLEFVKL